jgi:hypothetical protein
MKKCKMCGKDLIGREGTLCRHCKEAGKDRAKKGVAIGTAVSIAVAAVYKIAPKVAPAARKAIDVLRTFK